SEEVQEQQQPLLGVQEDKHLEQLFQSFTAGMHSLSEESRDFHTINHTFTLPSAVWEDDDLDYAHSPVEPSSIFYTPKHNPENTKEEPSQTSSSEDDPDVTLEVCRPNVTIETTFRECRSSPSEPQNNIAESVPPSVHTTKSSHMADIAELSSITCSPAQLQEWVGQNGALPSPRNTHLPACNSTPRSPHTHTVRGLRAPHRKVCVSPLVPHLQSLTETSTWGSVESPSHIEMYNTARLEHNDPIHRSVSGILSTPTERGFPHGDSDLPSSGNPEFTTASSGVRHKAAADVFTEEENESEELSDAEQCGESNGDESPEVQEAQRPDPTQRVAELECDTENGGSSCDADTSAEENKRAHTTLDEVLQGLLENGPHREPVMMFCSSSPPSQSV
ncbi:hypothetical protein QTP86_016941, partial [Hemibagrus guttatus]